MNRYEDIDKQIAQLKEEKKRLEKEEIMLLEKRKMEEEKRTMQEKYHFVEYLEKKITFRQYILSVIYTADGNTLPEQDSTISLAETQINAATQLYKHDYGLSISTYMELCTSICNATVETCHVIRQRYNPKRVVEANANHS
jgi:branched-subunit amino acid transport protein AzlD